MKGIDIDHNDQQQCEHCVHSSPKEKISREDEFEDIHDRDNGHLENCSDLPRFTAKDPKCEPHLQDPDHKRQRSRKLVTKDACNDQLVSWHETQDLTE